MKKNKNIVTLRQAENDFSGVAETADANGHIIIFDGDSPKYLLVDIESEGYFELTDDEKIDIAAKRVFSRFRPAFEELAK